MRSDPILRAVYRMKDQLAAELENVVDRLFVLLREAAKEHPKRMVNLSKTKAESFADASNK